MKMKFVAVIIFFFSSGVFSRVLLLDSKRSKQDDGNFEPTRAYPEQHQRPNFPVEVEEKGTNKLPLQRHTAANNGRVNLNVKLPPKKTVKTKKTKKKTPKSHAIAISALTIGLVALGVGAAALAKQAKAISPLDELDEEEVSNPPTSPTSPFSEDETVPLLHEDKKKNNGTSARHQKNKNKEEEEIIVEPPTNIPLPSQKDEMKTKQGSQPQTSKSFDNETFETDDAKPQVKNEEVNENTITVYPTIHQQTAQDKESTLNTSQDDGSLSKQSELVPEASKITEEEEVADETTNAVEHNIEVVDLKHVQNETKTVIEEAVEEAVKILNVEDVVMKDEGGLSKIAQEEEAAKEKETDVEESKKEYEIVDKTDVMDLEPQVGDKEKEELKIDDSSKIPVPIKEESNRKLKPRESYLYSTLQSQKTIERPTTLDNTDAASIQSLPASNIPKMRKTSNIKKYVKTTGKKLRRTLSPTKDDSDIKWPTTYNEKSDQNTPTQKKEKKKRPKSLVERVGRSLSFGKEKKKSITFEETDKSFKHIRSQDSATEKLPEDGAGDPTEADVNLDVTSTTPTLNLSMSEEIQAGDATKSSISTTVTNPEAKQTIEEEQENKEESKNTSKKENEEDVVLVEDDILSSEPIKIAEVLTSALQPAVETQSPREDIIIPEVLNTTNEDEDVSNDLPIEQDENPSKKISNVEDDVEPKSQIELEDVVKYEGYEYRDSDPSTASTPSRLSYVLDQTPDLQSLADSIETEVQLSNPPQSQDDISNKTKDDDDGNKVVVTHAEESNLLTNLP